MVTQVSLCLLDLEFFHLHESSNRLPMHFFSRDIMID